MRHNDISRMRRFDTRRKFQFTNVKGLTQLKCSDIHFDRVRQGAWQTDDLKGVRILLKNTATFNTFGFTIEVHRNVRSNLGFFIHSEEIHVKRTTRQRIMLDGFEENGTSAYTFHIEVDENAVRRTVSQKLSESLCVHFQVGVLQTTSVNYGWKPAFTAHLVEFS